MLFVVEKFSDGLQNNVIDFKNKSASRDMFDTLQMCVFVQVMGKDATRVMEKDASICFFLMFKFSYLCESTTAIYF